MPGSVIVAGARTPIGKLSGALASFSAADLGGIAIKAALERAGVAPELVDYVYMGQVILAGTGQQNARKAAAAAGIPLTVPSATVNKVCLSGLNTIYLADQMIAAEIYATPAEVPQEYQRFIYGGEGRQTTVYHHGISSSDRCAIVVYWTRFN